MMEIHKILVNGQEQASGDLISGIITGMTIKDGVANLTVRREKAPREDMTSQELASQILTMTDQCKRETINMEVSKSMLKHMYWLGKIEVLCFREAIKNDQEKADKE